jgi:hypothetical protein
MDYELRVCFPNGRYYTKIWHGADGLTACQNYADAHPGHTVTAWRTAERHGLFFGLRKIIE